MYVLHSIIDPVIAIVMHRRTEDVSIRFVEYFAASWKKCMCSWNLFDFDFILMIHFVFLNDHVLKVFEFRKISEIMSCDQWSNNLRQSLFFFVHWLFLKPKYCDPNLAFTSRRVFPKSPRLPEIELVIITKIENCVKLTSPNPIPKQTDYRVKPN